MTGKREVEILRRALEFYKELLAEYGLHVEWMRKAGVAAGSKREQQLAIGMLAISNYNSAKSVFALYEAGQGGQTLIFVRSQFEQAAKAEFFAKHPDRARDFLDLEPFERYKLTQGYNMSKEMREAVVADCRQAVKESPRLLRHQSKATKAAKRPDFLAIREALKLPSIEELFKMLKWDPALYVTIFLFGSLRIHGSINDVRTYFDRHADGFIHDPASVHAREVRRSTAALRA